MKKHIQRTLFNTKRANFISTACHQSGGVSFFGLQYEYIDNILLSSREIRFNTQKDQHNVIFITYENQ